MAYVQRRKVVFTVAITAFIGCLLVVGLLVFARYTFSLTEVQIQEIVDKKLPIEKSGMTVSDIDFSLANNTVSLVAGGSIAKLGESYSYVIKAVGVPRYEPFEGEFFFDPKDVEIVSLERTSEGSLSKTIKGFADKYLTDENEVGVKLKTLATDISIKVESWMQSAVEDAATFALKRVPVYKLPSDTKGIVAQAILDNVAVKDSKLFVELSLMRLTMWVLIFGLAAILSVGLMIAMISSPGLFAGVLVLGALSS